MNFLITFQFRHRVCSAIEADAHLEPFQIAKMELFAQVVNGLKSLTIFARSTILDG